MVMPAPTNAGYFGARRTAPSRRIVSPFKYTLPRMYATRSANSSGLPRRAGNGIDHNFVIDGTGLRVAAVLESAASRTRLELSTDQPGLQIYTGNHFNGIGPASDGGWHRQGDGIALFRTQNSHQPDPLDRLLSLMKRILHHSASVNRRMKKSLQKII